MSIEYIDTFEVNGSIYGIEQTKTGFQLWAYGCGIGETATRDEARRLLHTYICSKLRADHDSAQRRANAAAAALERLDGDVFNLARFIP